mgnify:FL=1
MADPWDILKLLSDPTRLRILNLLKDEELSVAELQEILDMGQSRISSHLALLRQGNLVVDRKDGKRSYYLMNPALEAAVLNILDASCQAIEASSVSQTDRQNLQRILDRRRRVQEEYFNSVAGKLGKHYCPGRSWEAIGQFLLQFVPPIDIVDLGAGEGLVSQMLARNAKSVVCVDSSTRMVQIGTELARKNQVDNLSYVRGDIESVPLESEQFDLAILSQALHHAQKPEVALNEAFRLIRPGGRLLVIDLKSHQFEKARELYADVWLGFSINFLHRLISDAGFERVEVQTVAKETVEPHFETLLASGIRPA